jgi:methylenetetrahydrofolate--tRNA-(uracil-5-)-methyltransferase
LVSYICNADSRYFQPMNVNFGLFPPITDLPDQKGKKAKQTIRARGFAERSLDILNNFINLYISDNCKR